MSWNEQLVNICDINDAYHGRLRKYSSIAEKYFGPFFFQLDRFTYDGHYWGISSEPELYRHYIVDLDGFREDPYCIHPSLMKTKIITWHTQDADEYSCKLNYHLKTNFGIHQGISFRYYDDYGYYSLNFSCTYDEKFRSFNKNLYIKEEKAIDGFKTMLMNELKNTIVDLERSRFNISNYLGQIYYKGQDTIFNHVNFKDKIDFLLSTNQIKNCDLNLIDLKLTKSENKVSMQYLSGLSDQAIANKLLVTRGAVKRHLHNIKVKLNVNKKQDLIKKLRKIELLDGFNKIAYK